MLKFNLPDLDYSKYHKLYVGKRSRYSTATGVSFINENLIVAASLLGKSIYLIQLNDQEHQIIDHIQCKTLPDLLDYRQGLIVTANNKSNTISLYNIKNNKLTLLNDILLDNIYPHGCRFIDNENIIITNKYKNNLGCFIYNTKHNNINK
jgi:hypothetical protein